MHKPNTPNNGYNNNGRNSRQNHRRHDSRYRSFHDHDHSNSRSFSHQQNRSGRLDKIKKPFFNLIQLKELSKKSNDEIMTIMAQKKDEFEELLRDSEKLLFTPDLLVVTLQILTHVCQANFTEIVVSVISHACSVNFLKSLERFITNLPFETEIEKIRNSVYHEDRDKFWNNLITFFKKVIEVLPTKARDELRIILQKINIIFDNIEKNKNYKIDENAKLEILKMYQELEVEISKVEEKNKQLAAMAKQADIEEIPPEDFRILSVIPTLGDLQNDKPFVRPCKINGAYNSVDHYLDVQFRLLREDFIYPLRSGIQEYLQNQRRYYNNDVRLYKAVKMITPEVIGSDVGIRIFFGIINVNWKQSKRFMVGGLLLLSNDDFNTILFATVLDRNEEDLKKGYVWIEPCKGTTITQDMYKKQTNFVMLESKVFFEPYLVVLNALQRINEQNFPMELYLVKAENTIMQPKYLANSTVLQYKGLSLPIGLDQSWPSAQKLKLDESQYQAFRCALTQEFALIQGPPGTGKTFLALEIVRTLLENETCWDRYGPIVVVCLTNHALDQFLEGILKYTDSIVRVGSRSKSELLAAHTLKERRRILQGDRGTGSSAIMYDIKRELEGILESMVRTRQFIKNLTTPNAIVPLRCLTSYCRDESFLRSQFTSTEELVNWLLGFKTTPFPENNVRNAVLEEEPEEDNQREHMDDELELTYKLEIKNDFWPVFPLKRIEELMQAIYFQIVNYINEDIHALPFDPLTDEFVKWEDDYNNLKEHLSALQRILAQHPLLNQYRIPSNNPRWQLYWKWIESSYQEVVNEVTQLEVHYRRKRLELNEAKQLVDLHTLKKHKIIGLTTAGAARLQSSLSALGAPIVLVEEAAEILESHVVCSLSKDTQHVILIGDHKQLRPKPSVYHLGKKFNLNISLFERMVNIQGDCTQLAHQHRMRPQIAKLITPTIYKVLYNHESVYNYPNVLGLEKNLFFLNHNNYEKNHKTDESWSNQYEAEFLVKLAKHLILQGYQATDITILCTYIGQLFLLTKEAANYNIMKHVRITTVDNYQGEENKIILLSLVRNNGEGNIGFLKEENRVCVALSRAREGLYIMGNMSDLVINNDIWPKIKRTLEEENAIGDHLESRCQLHRDEIIQIKHLNDFDKCPEGGCLKQCNLDLSCGHSCRQVCHILDRQHEQYQCKQKCLNKCPNNHPCPIECYKDCQPCKEIVERQLTCGHIVKMPCFKKVDQFRCYIEIEATLPDCKHNIKKACGDLLIHCKCSHPCEERLLCGHTCELNCHVNDDPDHIEYKCQKDCSNYYGNCTNNHVCKKRCHEECGPCPIKVDKARSCGHYFKSIPCSINIEEVACPKPCNRLIESCGHKCPLKCSEICGGCQIKVEKISSCGHVVKVKCCVDATRFKCYGKCEKVLPCGHPCTARCKDLCTKECRVMVPLPNPGLCGHTLSVHCYLQNSDRTELLKYCNELCKTELSCGHLCQGTCGQCKQGRVHVPCAQPCTKILICGHKCDVPCRKECPPCRKTCEIKCYHNKCRKKCGIPCTPCKERCQWRCRHRQCRKRCHELCDIEPCNEPCKQLLKCGHPCVGFCGDPCPLLCRVCNKEELTEIFLGHEDELDARFVLLEDCKHCIENKGLMKWLMKSDGSVGMKTCPRCKTPIMKCMRIMNTIKNIMKDVQDVKTKIFVQKQINLEKQQEQNFNVLHNMMRYPVVEVLPEMKYLLCRLSNQGIPVRRQKRQILNAQEIEVFGIILNILNQMFDSLELINKRNINSFKVIKNQVALLVESIPTTWQISEQELDDIQLELRRFRYMLEMCKTEVEKKEIGITLTTEKGYSTVMANLLSIKKFTETVETQVRVGLGELRKTNVEIERRMIVRAMQYSSGHWYKCPNGHLYAIGDCGRAMQRSRCNECGAVIGGEMHRLADGNSPANEYI